MHYFFISVLILLHPQHKGTVPQREQGKVWNKHRKACGSDTVFLRQVWVKFISCTISSSFISCQVQTCRVPHVLLAGSKKQAESKSILQPHLLASSGQSCLWPSWGKQSCWNTVHWKKMWFFWGRQQSLSNSKGLPALVIHCGAGKSSILGLLYFQGIVS